MAGDEERKIRASLEVVKEGDLDAPAQLAEGVRDLGAAAAEGASAVEQFGAAAGELSGAVGGAAGDMSSLGDAAGGAAGAVGEAAGALGEVGPAGASAKPAVDVVLDIGNAAEIAAQAIMAGAQALADFAMKAFEAQKTQAQAFELLKLGIENTGRAGEISAEQLQALATELQNTTTYGDESTLAMQRLLLPFKSLRSEDLPEVTKLVADLAAYMGQDLKTAAIGVAKALDDPTQGLGRLARGMKDLTDEQKEMIDKLVESGDLMGAQAIVFEHLNEAVGGAAEKLRDVGGGFDALNNSVGDVWEKIGEGGLFEALNDLAEQLRGATDSGAEGFERIGTAAAVVVDVIALLASQADVVGATLGGSFAAAALTISQAVELIAKAGSALPGELGEAFGKVDDELDGLQESLKQTVEQMQESLKDGLKEAPEQISQGLDRINERLKALKEGASDAGGAVGDLGQALEQAGDTAANAPSAAEPIRETAAAAAEATVAIEVYHGKQTDLSNQSVQIIETLDEHGKMIRTVAQVTREAAEAAGEGAAGLQQQAGAAGESSTATDAAAAAAEALAKAQESGADASQKQAEALDSSRDALQSITDLAGGAAEALQRMAGIDLGPLVAQLVEVQKAAQAASDALDKVGEG